MSFIKSIFVRSMHSEGNALWGLNGILSQVCGEIEYQRLGGQVWDHKTMQIFEGTLIGGGHGQKGLMGAVKHRLKAGTHRAFKGFRTMT